MSSTIYQTFLFYKLFNIKEHKKKFLILYRLGGLYLEKFKKGGFM